MQIEALRKLTRGTRVAENYIIQDMIAEGGMSFLYKAVDIKGQEYCVKFLKVPISDSKVEDIIRFKREVEVVSRFDCSHIIPIYAWGEYEGVPFIVMQIVEGNTLKELFAQERNISELDKIDILIQMLQALDYVHQQGIIHRDIKADNVFIAEDNTVKLLDFGVSLITSFNFMDKQEMVGTFAYMPPEVAGRANHPVDERSDLYSLGILMYRLFTNRLPFEGWNIKKLLHQHVSEIAERPSAIESNINSTIETIIIKLLEKEPSKRYQSAKGLLHDLKRYQNGDRSFVVAENDQNTKLTYQTGLVGRDKELSRLKNMHLLTGMHKGSCCLISGDPGIGKSRLVEEYRMFADQEDCLFLGGRCLDQENKTPYLPFKDIVNEYIKYLNNLEEEKRNIEIGKIKELLNDQLEVIVRLSPRIKVLFGDVKPLVALDPERENQRFLTVVSKFFLNILQTLKVKILYVDDLQWADEGTNGILRELLSNIEGTNTFILGAYRVNEIDSGHPVQRLIRMSKRQNFPLDIIELEKFDKQGITELTAKILVKNVVEQGRLEEFVYDKSDGNPFFALNIIRELVENKALTCQTLGQWKEDWSVIDALGVSVNILDVILNRIKTGSQKMKQMLSIAAIIGRDFELDLLYSLMDEQEDKVIEYIDEALSMQLIQKGSSQGEYLFSHDKIRDVFIWQVSEEERKTIHLNIANTLEQIGTQKETIFRLAHHFAESGNQEKTLEYALPAADMAKSRYANEDAIKYFELVVSLLEEIGQTGSDIWIKAKEGLLDVSLTMAIMDKAIQIADTLLKHKKTNLEKAQIYRRLGDAYFKSGEWEKSEIHLFKALDSLEVHIPKTKIAFYGSLLVQIIIFYLSELKFSWLVRLAGARSNAHNIEISLTFLRLSWLSIFTQGMKFCYYSLRLGNHTEYSKRLPMEYVLLGKASLGALFMSIGLFNKSEVFLKKSWSMRKKYGFIFGMGECEQWLGYSYCWRGSHKLALDALYRGVEIFRSIGDPWEEAMCFNGLGFTEICLCNYIKSKEYYTRYYNIGRKNGDWAAVAISAVGIARNNIKINNFSEAEHFLRIALDVSMKYKILFTESYSKAYLAEICIERGKYEEALELLLSADKLHSNHLFMFDVVSEMNIFLPECLLLKYKEGKVKLKDISFWCSKAKRKLRPWPNHYAGALRVNAKYYALKGRKKKAEKLFLQSIEHATKYERRYEIGKGYYEYGLFLNAQGRIEAAINVFKKALAVFTEIGAKLYIQRVSEQLGLEIIEDKSITEQHSTKQSDFLAQQNMGSVYEITQELSKILDYDNLLDAVVDKSIELAGAGRGMIMLYDDEDNKNLQIKVIRDSSRSVVGSKSFAYSKQIIERVKESNEPLLVGNAGEDEILKNEYTVRISELKSIICLPLMAGETNLGILYLDNHLMTNVFSNDDLKMLTIVASQAGVSIQNARLYRKAVTDPLTDLYNRSFFDNFLLKKIEESKCNCKSLELLMIDLDGFKDINDTYGHQAGDTVLKAVGRVFSHNIKRCDIAVRYGGDEFAIVLCESEENQSKLLAQKIMQDVRNIALSHIHNGDEVKLKVTLSIGYAILETGMQTDQLIQKADQALYQAKRLGKNVLSE